MIFSFPLGVEGVSFLHLAFCGGGKILDQRMGFVWDSSFFLHDTGEGHPESILRLRSIESHLQASSCWEQMEQIVCRKASYQECLETHDAGLVDALFQADGKERVVFDADTVSCPFTTEAALVAAGSSMDLARKVWEGSLKRGFAYIRPPGHHATQDTSMGFCYLNNVAMVAQMLLKQGLERILIVDWDVHHGNGTQDIFEGDNRVLFFSIHESGNYPGTGQVREVGSQKGRGYTLNVPLETGAGDVCYRHVFRELLRPIALQFQPQIVLLSAGFDAHRNDPLGGMNVSSKGFGQLADELVAVAEKSCDGKIVAFLEGGYDLQGLGESVVETTQAFLRDGRWLEEEKHVSSATSLLVQKCKKEWKPFWELV